MTTPALPPGEVHLWRIPLDLPADVRLAPDEERRAMSFHKEADRRRFRAARGALRAILGRYVDAPPASLAFAARCRVCGAEDHGKPRLAEGGPAFSLSHAGGLALLAVARGAEVGVDVEAVRRDLDHEAIAAEVFTPRERATLAAAPADQRAGLFCSVWTLKEACVKAMGHGLVVPAGGTPLRELEVLGPDGAPRARVEAPGGARFALRALEPAPGYLGAVAVEGTALAVRGFEFTPASTG